MRFSHWIQTVIAHADVAHVQAKVKANKLLVEVTTGFDVAQVQMNVSYAGSSWQRCGQVVLRCELSQQAFDVKRFSNAPVAALPCKLSDRPSVGQYQHATSFRGLKGHFDTDAIKIIEIGGLSRGVVGRCLSVLKRGETGHQQRQVTA